MPLKLNAFSGGSVTLDPASTASDFTHTLPAVSGTVVTTGSSAVVTPAMLSTGAPAWNSSGDLSFNSGFGSVGVAYGCRAWVNFNGTGTIAIRGSGNVSSIGDIGTGTYQINFSTALVDANYSTVVSIGNGTPGSNDNSGFTRVYQGTTTQQQVGTVNPPSSAFEDYSRVNVAIFR